MRVAAETAVRIPKGQHTKPHHSHYGRELAATGRAAPAPPAIALSLAKYLLSRFPLLPHWDSALVSFCTDPTHQEA